MQAHPVHERSDALPASPPTRTRFPVTGTPATYQVNRGDSTAETAGFADPEETHGFLSNKDRSSSSTGSGVARTRNSGALLLTTWWIEILSLLISTAALIAIAVTMAEYNEKEQPTWKYAINLNTLIAILSTLVRACMVVVVEEVISQLKWMMFRRPKPLRHLAHFDAAARGPWGSSLLLFRIKTLEPALLGCLVIILSVGIGPFSQQAVKAVSCDVPHASAEASIRISRWMHSDNISKVYDMDMDTKVAILNGLANSNNTRSELTPDCSTGNCSFPSHNSITHASVGICKKCVDMRPWIVEKQTEELDIATNKTGLRLNLVLPDDSNIGANFIGYPLAKIMTISGHHGISRYKINSNSEYTYNPWNGSFLAAFDDTFKDIFASSIFNVSVVSFTNNDCGPLGSNGRPIEKCSHHGLNTSLEIFDYLNVAATACSFFPCVRDYHGSVRNTLFEETIIKETPIRQRQGQGGIFYPDHIQSHEPCRIQDQTYTNSNISSVSGNQTDVASALIGKENAGIPRQCFFGVSGIFASSLAAFMKSTLVGYCAGQPDINPFNGTSDDYNGVMCADSWFIKRLLNKGNASYQSIDTNMQSIALAITSEMRKQGTDLDGYLNNANSPINYPPLYAKGTVIRTTVCTKFDWKWLAFPLVLIAITILLLCIMCGKMLFDRQEIPAWKSSLLPLLFTANQIGSTVNAGDLDKIKADTDKVVVSLSHDGKGWEFVSEDNPPQKKGRLWKK